MIKKESFLTVCSHLVELHEHKDSDEVPDRESHEFDIVEYQHLHEGRVELEGDVGGTDVVAGGHDSLHHESHSHGVVEPVLAGHSQHAAVHALLFSHFPLEFIEFLFTQFDDIHKKETEDTVAEIAEDVIEIINFSKRFLAKVVVEADVLIA